MDRQDQKLHITFISIHPRFIEAYFAFGVIHSATSKGFAEMEALDLRKFAIDKHGTVDDHPYGGGDGMVLRPEPLADAVKSLDGDPYVITTSPCGKSWSQDDALRFANFDRRLVLICGRFGGLDQRFINHYVKEEFSMGDFILSGGELPSLMIVDSILRHVPGVLGNFDSPINDSFSSGCKGLLEHPLYTRPPVFEGEQVPQVLLSGDHKSIEAWREEEMLRRTREKRPDLIESS